MKKIFKNYLIVWIVNIICFNLVVFITPNEMQILEEEYTKFGGAFWIAYAFIIVSYIGNLICSYKACESKNPAQLFLNIPLIRISYSGQIIMLIAGVICMIIPNLSLWLGTVICLIVLAVNVVALIKAETAAELIQERHDSIVQQTMSIRTMIAMMSSIKLAAKTEAARKAAEKLYEAIRYSDPVSSDKLNDIDMQLAERISGFKALVEASSDGVEETADEIIALIKTRNEMCKNMK